MKTPILRKVKFIDYLITVYCCCCLGSHDIMGLGKQLIPHFYVNVTDIETLETEDN